MASVEDPDYLEEKSICPYISGRIEITLGFIIQGGPKILERLKCPNYIRRTKKCLDGSTQRGDGLCGYLEYIHLGGDFLY
jgi:hypothetical protein